MEHNKIKLVIWDLDNTFWEGILSESSIVPISQNIELIKTLTDCGIINSICSKNTFEQCESKLKELEIFDHFVFASIDWTPKGQRIQNLIKAMSLRPENVLFIDDDIVNLEEAKHYSPELMVAFPKEIEGLIDYANSLDKKDLQHTRLEQYKLLELKNMEQRKFSSNEEFLYASEIQVELSDNCDANFDRILDLILRANQLNFTKKRINEDELHKILNDPSIKCGYVSVNDRFGDYGIVGFYALKENNLEHFVFSCRTIGQGIEQYVYAYLNYPNIEISGVVVSQLTNDLLPPWINQDIEYLDKSEGENKMNNIEKSRILLKGSCQWKKITDYINDSDIISCEYNYVNLKANNIIEANNHSIHILGAKKWTSQEKNELANDCVFIDPEMLKDTFFDNQYDLIFLSTFMEAKLGVYQKKNSKLRAAFGLANYPLTNKEYWNDYISGKIYNADNQFTLEYLEEFAEKYEYIGRTTPSDYIERLKQMLDYLNKKTTICLVLGSETAFESDTNDDSHVYYKELNSAIRLFAKENGRIKYVDINEFVTSQSCFNNDINSFTAKVYYDISQKMVEIINETFPFKIASHSIFTMYYDLIVRKIRLIFKFILKDNENSAVYKFFNKLYKYANRKPEKCTQ